MTEFFAQPDDTGELQASELNTSLGESLFARAGEAMGSGVRTLSRNIEAGIASEDVTPQQIAADPFGAIDPVAAYAIHARQRHDRPELTMDDAKERIKQEGVTGQFKLPDQPTIKQPVLDLMISHAKERQQYDAALSRGPSGLLPGALGFATEVGAGMIDPINVAAFSIPIMGEARFGMMLANAGESLASRAAVRAGVGAAQGAVGSTLLEPGQWWLHTRDGQDYTYADALRGVIMGAAMGGAFGAVHGGINDVRARAAGRPLAGSVDDLAQRALAGDEQAAGILQATPEGRRALAGEQPAASTQAAPAPAQALPATEEVPPGITAEPRPATQIPEPEAVFTDLPAQVREDTVRASMADAINGNLGRGGDLLKEAAKDDPRIAESLAAGRESTIVNAAEFSEPARAVFTDMSTQLKAAGMGEEEAAANAAVVAARYEARAARLEGAGGTAEDLYRAEGIRVQRGGIDDVIGRSYGQPATVPTFFSAVSRAINAARQEKASPDQWLATLRNTPGVKQEELQWLGLPDWLKEQTGTVTRKDIQDYVRANNIEVREVEKGGISQATPEEQAALLKRLQMTAAGGEFGDPATEGVKNVKMLMDGAIAGDSKSIGDLETLGIPDGLISPFRDRGREPTKFQSYTLPGGENYREMLLTLPNMPRFDDVAPSPAAQARHAVEWDRLTAEINRERDRTDGPANNDLRWDLEDQRDQLHAEMVRETMADMPAYMKRGPDYSHAHWPESNVLSHIRFNDRTIDGKKTLFIEEIQSDWHQAGKRRGYATEHPTSKNFTVEPHGAHEWSVVDDQGHRIITVGTNDYAVQRAHEFNRDGLPEHLGAAERSTGAVPDAPFKTTWPELAFKRMIRYAAENGYEKIAWTPGEVQAERYDLSKHINNILYIKDRPTDVEGTLLAYGNNGRDTVINKQVKDTDLPDVIGKEAADKLINVKHEPIRGSNRIQQQLMNADLKIGGEGMKGFYDKILPATVNKLVKKYGAKVDDERLVVPHDPNSEEGHYAVDQDGNPVRAKDVHAVDVTPELRKAATEEGFPLFQREPGGEMRGRITLADNRAIIDLFRSADKSTFMHETGHLWLDEMARDSARQNAPEGIRKDMDTVLNWLGAERPDAITTEQHEKFARGFETYLASGEAPTSGLRAVFERFKDWLSAIYKGLVGAGEEMPPEIRRVMDRMLATPEQLGEKAEIAGADILPGPRAARGPRARDPATFSLLEFLASRGGIRSSDPLISDLRSSIGRSNRFVPGFGQLIRAPRELSTAARMGGGRAPMTLDQAREAAVEAGYLHDEDAHTGGESTTTINTLLEAMDREMRGERVYRAGHEPARKADFDPDEEMHRLHSAIDDAVRDVGLDPVALPEPLRARILEIMTKEGERDPEIAYERAVMEETHYGEEANRNERIQDHIPGWDQIHDVGRPAQAPGGPAAQFTGPAGADAGAAPRRAGGDDRQAGGQRAAGAGNGAAAPAGRPGADWRALAAATKSDDADLIAPSRAAAREKPPESTDTPEKAVSAAELKAKEAEQLLADILPRLTEEERIMMTDMLNAADRDRSEREQIVREGAACLAAGLAGAV